MSIESLMSKKGRRYKAIVRINGQKRTKTFRRKIDALNWERDLLVARENGDQLERQELEAQKAKTTLDQFRRVFERDYASLHMSEGTRSLQKKDYVRVIQPVFGSRVLNSITSQDIAQFLTKLRMDDGMSPERVNKTRQCLQTMFNRAVDWDYLLINPVLKVKALKLHNTSETTNFLTQKELFLLLEHLKVHDFWSYRLVMLYSKTGLRWGEGKALRVQDFHSSESGDYLTVERTFCRHSMSFQNRTKGRSSRLVPLSPGMSEFLKSCAEGKKPEAPLVYDSWDDDIYQTKFRKRFNKALKACEIKHVRIHDLRHTFAVHFLENGGHQYDLQKIMGHRDLKMTQRYSHFSKEMANRARMVLSSSFDFVPVR